MDILSHGMWGIILLKFLKNKGLFKGKLRWGFLWGIFPDFFAFAPWFIYSIFVIKEFGRPSLSDPFINIVSHLYNLSHSLVIFTTIAIILYLLGRWTYALIPWALNIITDIPTHTKEFFPTPFLWPISAYTFDGFSWGQPWFLALNWGLIIILLIYLYKFQPKRTKN